MKGFTKMAKLDITKACEKGGQLLHNNQHYDVSMDDLHNLFKSSDYAKGLSKVFCLGFCQGYKAGQKTSIKKTKRPADTEAEFYLEGIKELSGKIENIDKLRLAYKYVKAAWMEEAKERTEE